MYHLAVVYAERKHADLAIQALARARQIAPARPDVLLLLGRESIEEGFLDDAIEVLGECVKLDSGKVEPHLLLGEALTKKKLYQEALAEYRALAKLEPDNPQAYNSIGRTLQYLFRGEEAKRPKRR